MKKLLVKLGLRIVVWVFDVAYNLIDKDEDGKISKKEIFEAADYLDRRSRSLINKLKKR